MPRSSRKPSRETPGLRPDAVEGRDQYSLDRSRAHPGPSKVFSAALKERGVLINSAGTNLLRAVTHLDVSAVQLERAADTIRRVGRDLAASARTPALAHT